MPSPTAPTASTITATITANLCCLIPETMYSALDGGLEDVASDETGAALPAEPRVERMLLGGTVVSTPALPTSSRRNSHSFIATSLNRALTRSGAFASSHLS